MSIPPTSRVKFSPNLLKPTQSGDASQSRVKNSRSTESLFRQYYEAQRSRDSLKVENLRQAIIKKEGLSSSWQPPSLNANAMRSQIHQLEHALFSAIA